MKKINRVIFLLAFLLTNFSTAQTTEIQYLVNEGVLIKSGVHKILIDAIFTKEFDYLDVLADSELEKFKTVKPPYKDIDLILTTHVHGDHFNARFIGEHIQANKKVKFLATQEVINDFSKKFGNYNAIIDRINTVTPELFTSKIVDFKGITIEVLRIEHFGTKPWSEAENTAFLIHVNGKKILHFGDGKIDLKNLKPFNLKDKNIDVAILPYWQLGSLDQKDIIEKYINPKQILVAHIPLKSYVSAQKNINTLKYKNAIAFTKIFQSIVLD